jgi:pectate lyase
MINRKYVSVCIIVLIFGFLFISCSTGGIREVKVESITINEGDITLKLEESEQLTVTVLPDNATDTNVVWLTDDPDIASVSDDGLVTALAVGSTTIIATTLDGSGVSDSITVTVRDIDPILVENISINEEDFTLMVEENKQLSITVLPDDAANADVTWSTDDAEIATVSPEGIVTAIAVGNTTITATAVDGSDVSGSVTVTVREDIPMTPQEIFDSLKGRNVTSKGWADMANSGTGLNYTNPANLTLIDDEKYPNPVAKRTAFTDAINSDTEKFIIVSGDIDLSDGRINDNDKSYFDQFGDAPNYNRVNGDIRFNLRSNTTLIGINDARLMFGGININNRSNIIIRNITFYDAHGSTEQDTTYFPDSKASIDALTIQGTSDGIWVDHCKFTDGTCNDMSRNYNHDGSFDIPRGKNVTVSWCEFTNHDKVMLVAGSDSLIDVEDRQITLHHNYFHACTQRMPRTRGTQMHIYNNYYNDIGVPENRGYAMGPGVNAHFIVENNYFGSILSGKIVDWYDNATYPAIVWSAGNNQTVARSPNDKTGGSKPWEPAYVYTLESNSNLQTSIPAGAGPTLEFMK